jgi:hypothetical protein
VLDVLARHADVIGDLVDIIALLSAGKDSRAAQTMDGRVVGVVRFDIPLVFLAEPTLVNGLETHCSDAGLLAFGGMTMAPLLER